MLVMGHLGWDKSKILQRIQNKDMNRVQQIKLIFLMYLMQVFLFELTILKENLNLYLICWHSAWIFLVYDINNIIFNVLCLWIVLSLI